LFHFLLKCNGPEQIVVEFHKKQSFFEGESVMKRAFLLLMACVINMGALAFWQWQLKQQVNKPVITIEQTSGPCDETPVPEPPFPPPPKP